MKIQQIGKFEKLNPDIAVNVMYLNADQNIMPLYASKYHERKHAVNMLMLTENYRLDEKGNQVPCNILDSTATKSHYTLVKDMSRLFNSSTKHEHKIFVCPFCLHRFTKDFRLKKHLPHCSKHAACVISFPSGEKKQSKEDKMEG